MIEVLVLFVNMNKPLSRFVISLLLFVLALTVVSPFSSKAEEGHKYNQKEVDQNERNTSENVLAPQQTTHLSEDVHTVSLMTLTVT